MYIVLTEMARGKRQETSIFFTIPPGSQKMNAIFSVKKMARGLYFRCEKSIVSRFVPGACAGAPGPAAFHVIHVPAPGSASASVNGKDAEKSRWRAGRTEQK